MPDAIIPATKYWLNLTPGAIVSLNTDPKITIKIKGKKMVKTTDSLWRINCLISKAPRCKPNFIVFNIHQSFLSKYLQVMGGLLVTLEFRLGILRKVLL